MSAVMVTSTSVAWEARLKLDGVPGLAIVGHRRFVLEVLGQNSVRFGRPCAWPLFLLAVSEMELTSFSWLSLQTTREDVVVRGRDGTFSSWDDGQVHHPRPRPRDPGWQFNYQKRPLKVSSKMPPKMPLNSWVKSTRKVPFLQCLYRCPLHNWCSMAFSVAYLQLNCHPGNHPHTHAQSWKVESLRDNAIKPAYNISWSLPQSHLNVTQIR